MVQKENRKKSKSLIYTSLSVAYLRALLRSWCVYMFVQVYIAEADGISEYGNTVTPSNRLVAVKFLSNNATEREK